MPANGMTTTTWKITTTTMFSTSYFYVYPAGTRGEGESLLFGLYHMRRDENTTVFTRHVYTNINITTWYFTASGGLKTYERIETGRRSSRRCRGVLDRDRDECDGGRTDTHQTCTPGECICQRRRASAGPRRLVIVLRVRDAWYCRWVYGTILLLFFFF